MARFSMTPGDYHAFESVTVAGTAIELTDATKLNATFATITVETAQIRFTLDGTTPTATVGHLLNPGDILTLDSAEQITQAQFIRVGATSGTIKVSYGN